MAIHYYLAQKAEQLRQTFIANYQATQRNIFKKDLIVTQSAGINEWLVAGATEELGIFANYEFYEPARFISQIAAHFNLYNDYAFAPQNIKWRLYVLLENEEFKQKYPHVSKYYAHEEIKRVQLAEKVAKLFDNYTVYRELYLVAWSENKDSKSYAKNSEFCIHEEWQQWLWYTMKQSIQETKGKDLVDSMNFKQVLTKNLSTKQISKYNSISLFALSNITPYHREIIEALGQLTDLHIYMLNPSQDLQWASEAGHLGNPFLTSCSKQGIDLFRSTVATAKASDSISQLATDTSEATLLQRLHKDIYLNQDRSQDNYTLDAKDDSLVFASSYTEVREVEALYNYLLKRFEQDPELKPHDVLIHITDMDRYEPFISAVFDNGPVALPYSISDTKGDMQQSLQEAITKLFELSLKDFQADSVLALLEFSPIRQRFGLEDMDDVRALVNEATIRFGIEGEEMDESYLVSWQHGLKRLIIGTAIKGGEELHYQGQDLYICDNAEGERALNIYRIKAFVDTIIALNKTQQENKTIHDWINFVLDEVVEELFLIDDFVNEELDSIKQKLHQLQVVVTGAEREIPFRVFQELAMKGLRIADQHKRYITGRITFAEMMPTRTIPYKVKAVLGLNAEVFPRQKNALGFDLMALDTQAGDSNPRESDQYLFLDAVLSARQHLYLSYIGNSVKDNSTLPPSLLVEELQNYISQIIGQEALQHIVATHPLHSFSKKYNTNENPELYSYLTQTMEVQERESEAIVQEDKTQTSIDLNDFIKFFQHPIRWYYNKTLQIYYNDDEQTVEHTELFDLDNLQEWQLKSDLIFIKEEDDKNQYIAKQKSDGCLPLSNMGRILVSETEDKVANMKQKLASYIDEHENTSWQAEVELDNTTLVASIDNVFDHTQVFYNMSSDKRQAKYKCQAWLTHLFARAAGQTFKTAIITPSSESTYAPELLTSEQAKSKLNLLLGYYQLGQNAIIPYVIDGLVTNKDDELPKAKEMLKALEKEGTKDYNKPYSDAYIEKEMTCSDMKELMKEQEEDLQLLAKCLFPPTENN